MPSHALSSKAEARTRRRARRQSRFRQLRDWWTWVRFLALLAGLSLSQIIVGHLWPQANGVGYLMTHVVVGAVLGGAIGALLVLGIVVAVTAYRSPDE